LILRTENVKSATWFFECTENVYVRTSGTSYQEHYLDKNFVKNLGQNFDFFGNFLNISGQGTDKRTENFESIEKLCNKN
jgi:hypothetical protein